MYRFITSIPVNLGRWVSIDNKHGIDRGEGFRELYFEEAVMDWSWFPKNSYGKFYIEMKRDRKSGEGKVEAQLSWVKAVRDGGAGKFNRIEGAIIEESQFRPWELYETDYFKLPEWKGPVLLYLMGRTEGDAVLAVAMFTLAVFEKVE